MTAALYVRVSRESQNVENQEHVLQAFICEQEWSWCDRYSYRDVDSGANPDRTQFQRMLADAEKRKFDVLVFWSLDRLTREGASTRRFRDSRPVWGLKRFISFSLHAQSAPSPVLQNQSKRPSRSVSAGSWL